MKKRGRIVCSILMVLSGASGCGSHDKTHSRDDRSDLLKNVAEVDDVLALPNSIPPGRATEADIIRFCSGCHALPSPASFPRHVWRKEVYNGYFFFKHSNRTDLPVPRYRDSLAWYQNRAPAYLDFSEMPVDGVLDQSSRFTEGTAIWGHEEPMAAVASLVSEETADGDVLLMSDMGTGKIWRGAVGGENFKPELIGECRNPCRIVSSDLDQDSHPDYLVADLGSFRPRDHTEGVIWWFKRQGPQLAWEKHRLLHGLSRPCDVAVLDYDKDGDMDLVVAEFGWHKTGSITCFENIGFAEALPQFRRSVVDDRHGAIHLPVTDLNGDGWPDFVALLSQEHELLEGFMNDKTGGWKKVRLGETHDPSWGASGAVVVDLDGDGDQDVLTSHGDTMDSGQALPTHGVTWWENQGKFPFLRHKVTTMPGCYSAQPADLDGDGDLDIAAISYLSLSILAGNDPGTFDSVIWLEQIEPGVFQRHFLQENFCNHVTCTIADWNGDGNPDIVTAPCDFEGLRTETGLTIFLSVAKRDLPNTANRISR